MHAQKPLGTGTLIPLIHVCRAYGQSVWKFEAEEGVIAQNTPVVLQDPTPAWGQ